MRIIPAPAHLVDLISVARRIFHRGDHDQRMIPRLNGGGGQAAFRNALQRAGQITGIDLTSLVTRDDPETGRRLPHPHDARKAYASLLRLAGVDPGGARLAMHAVSGACGGLAGVALAVSSSSGSSLGGAALELDAIACAVVGGASLSGGRASVAGA